MAVADLGGVVRYSDVGVGRAAAWVALEAFAALVVVAVLSRRPTGAASP
jgi:hypothetical protein